MKKKKSEVQMWPEARAAPQDEEQAHRSRTRHYTDRRSSRICSSIERQRIVENKYNTIQYKNPLPLDFAVEIVCAQPPILPRDLAPDKKSADKRNKQVAGGEGGEESRKMRTCTT